jgi:hypothetical protein
MIAFQDDAHAAGQPPACRLAVDQRPHADQVPHALVRRLLLAGELLSEDRDEAALLLDGLLRDVVADWFSRRGFAPSHSGESLDSIAHDQPPFAWRLRLALRAPNVEARLVHCAALLALLPIAGVQLAAGEPL